MNRVGDRRRRHLHIARRPVPDANTARAQGFRDAVRCLEERQQQQAGANSNNPQHGTTMTTIRPAVVELVVHERARRVRWGWRRDDDDDAAATRRDDEEDISSLGRFVDLLEASRTVRKVTFFFKQWSCLPHEDMERLFRDVLPKHPIVKFLNVNISDLPSEFLRMLLENLGTAQESTLDELHLDGLDAIDPNVQAQAVDAIVDMLNRDAPIANLVLSFPLPADFCKLICQAVSRNTHLVGLDLCRVENVRADSLQGLVSTGSLSSSSLEELNVMGSFFVPEGDDASDDDDPVAFLARQLRTNETIVELCLHQGNYPPDYDGSPRATPKALQELLDLVKTYNYTLESIREDQVGFIGRPGSSVRRQLYQYTRRNGRIRTALQMLLQQNRTTDVLPRTSRPVVVRHVPRERLPILLGFVSDIPTALFRVLKMGYGVEVSECIMAKLNSRGPPRGLRRSHRLRRRRGLGDDD